MTKLESRQALEATPTVQYSGSTYGTTVPYSRYVGKRGDLEQSRWVRRGKERTEVSVCKKNGGMEGVAEKGERCSCPNDVIG